MKIQFPKAAEVLIVVDEKASEITIDINKGEHSIVIDKIDYFQVSYVPFDHGVLQRKKAP